MRGELARGFHAVQVSCSSLSSALHSREGGAALVLEREKSLRLQLEQQLRERVGEMMGLQTRTDAERTGLSLRWVSGLRRLAATVTRESANDSHCATFRVSDLLRESERLKGQVEERDRDIAVLRRQLKVICKKQICAAKRRFILKFPFPC